MAIPDNLIERIMIEKMKDNIKNLGHKKTWKCIESFQKSKTRIAFRTLFFKAGGKI